MSEKLSIRQHFISSFCGPFFLQKISPKIYLAVASGFLRTRMTESPRRNILEMKRSLLTGLLFFLPFPVLGTSTHISLTFSRTMLQCLKKKTHSHREKTSFWGFRPSLTQTRLYNLTKWLEDWNFGLELFYLHVCCEKKEHFSCHGL